MQPTSQQHSLESDSEFQFETLASSDVRDICDQVGLEQLKERTCKESTKGNSTEEKEAENAPMNGDNYRRDLNQSKELSQSTDSQQDDDDDRLRFSVSYPQFSQRLYKLEPQRQPTLFDRHFEADPALLSVQTKRFEESQISPTGSDLTDDGLFSESSSENEVLHDVTWKQFKPLVETNTKPDGDFSIQWHEPSETSVATVAKELQRTSSRTQKTVHPVLLGFLRRVPHLLTLSHGGLVHLASHLSIRRYQPGSVLRAKGECVRELYIVLSGEINVYKYGVGRHSIDGELISYTSCAFPPESQTSTTFEVPCMAGDPYDSIDPQFLDDERSEDEAWSAVIGPGTPFAYDAMLFQEHSHYTYVASSQTPVLLGTVPYTQFHKYLRKYPALRLSLAYKLSADMLPFAPFKGFARAIFGSLRSSHAVHGSGGISRAALGGGHYFTASAVGRPLDLERCLARFTAIDSAVYVGAKSTIELDMAGWSYALRRLPLNIFETAVLDLVVVPPAELTHEWFRLGNEADRLGHPDLLVRHMVKLDSNAHHSEICPYGLCTVPTTARRRFTFASHPHTGRTTVLLRDATTDLLDLMGCLCIHILELRKLQRHFLQEVSALNISRLLHQEESRATKLTDGNVGPSPNFVSNLDETLAKLRLPASHVFADHLLPVYGGNTAALQDRLKLIASGGATEPIPRINLRLPRRYAHAPAQHWVNAIHQKLLELLGISQYKALPRKLRIDLLSSNAHGIKNCLGPTPRVVGENIRHVFADHPSRHIQWICEEDFVYHMMPSYEKWVARNGKQNCDCVLKTENKDVSLDQRKQQGNDEYRPQSSTAREATDVFCKANRSSTSSPTTPRYFHTLVETRLMGLQVDLVHLNAVPPPTVDPELRSDLAHFQRNVPSNEPHILLNLDFPFAAQAEATLRELLIVFGRHIRSVNVMGKAGGLVGSRGDIQLATRLLLCKNAVPHDDFTDEIRSVESLRLDRARLQELLTLTSSPSPSGHSGEVSSKPFRVHSGLVATIPGTLLSDQRLLYHYRLLWHAIGCEMEGSYFARALEQAQMQGIVSKHVEKRFIYYTSDLPLVSQGASLAQPMRPNEGVSPVYGVIRALLKCCFQDS